MGTDDERRERQRLMAESLAQPRDEDEQALVVAASRTAGERTGRGTEEEPNLWFASTRQLLDELAARFEVEALVQAARGNPSPELRVMAGIMTRWRDVLPNSLLDYRPID